MPNGGGRGGGGGGGGLETKNTLVFTVFDRFFKKKSTMKERERERICVFLMGKKRGGRKGAGCLPV